MLGPAAPKDPEKQRSFFYIMRGKQVYGSKQPDGRGISFLYQSDGRLESSAKVVGQVEDEEIISLLGSVEGFKKLVHSIGVSVEMDDREKSAKFVFQMYGKVDLYGGGTNLICSAKGDGNEQRIYLSDIDWCQDDDIPGQIRIEMDEPDLTATVSVRFYLNDGFVAPEQEDEIKVDCESKEYKDMIAKSLLQTGNTKRLADAINRAKAGEEITIAYIGGSITQGAGATPINTQCYAYKSFQKIKDLVGSESNINFVKAGVGGTPSELGMLRFDRDVLGQGKEPDILVVEFAVNDAGDETEGDCFESLVRKALKLSSQPAVIILFSVFADDYNLQDRLIPVGKRYNLPMVSLKEAVTPQFYDKDNRIVTKNQYFYDIFHPTNLGHEIMADCLLNLVEKTMEKVEAGQGDESFEIDFESAPAIGATFDDVIFFDKKDMLDGVVIRQGAYEFTDDVLQSVEMNMDLEVTPEFPYNWMYDGSKNKSDAFEMDINCKALVMIFKDSGEVDAAKAKVFVDGKEVRLADPYVNRWLHCNPIIVINEKEASMHTVRVQVIDEDIEKKFTILGFGAVL